MEDGGYSIRDLTSGMMKYPRLRGIAPLDYMVFARIVVRGLKSELIVV